MTPVWLLAARSQQIQQSPADKVEGFLAAVDELLTEGLVTTERVEVRAYRARPTDR